MRSSGIFGPIFIEENVTGSLYRKLLEDEFIPFAYGRDQVISSWFMLGGARRYRTSDVFQRLFEHFGERVIGLDYPRYCEGGIEWSPIHMT